MKCKYLRENGSCKARWSKVGKPCPMNSQTTENCHMKRNKKITLKEKFLIHLGNIPESQINIDTGWVGVSRWGNGFCATNSKANAEEVPCLIIYKKR